MSPDTKERHGANTFLQDSRGALGRRATGPHNQSWGKGLRESGLPGVTDDSGQRVVGDLSGHHSPSPPPAPTQGASISLGRAVETTLPYPCLGGVKPEPPLPHTEEQEEGRPVGSRAEGTHLRCPEAGCIHIPSLSVSLTQKIPFLQRQGLQVPRCHGQGLHFCPVTGTVPAVVLRSGSLQDSCRNLIPNVAGVRGDEVSRGSLISGINICTKEAWGPQFGTQRRCHP